MSDTARNRILARLQGGLDHSPSLEAAPRMHAAEAVDRQVLIDSLKARMEAVMARIHVVPAADWLDTLASVLAENNIGNLLYGPDSALGKALTAHWKTAAPTHTKLVAYQDPVEQIKDTLFTVDAGITGTAGAVADTGAVIVWPDAAEPRLLSLVPPVHIAVLDAADIYPDMATAMEAMGWAKNMPTNLLMISGPSKTADIEFTLAFGVHGPKAMIVIIRT